MTCFIFGLIAGTVIIEYPSTFRSNDNSETFEVIKFGNVFIEQSEGEYQIHTQKSFESMLAVDHSLKDDGQGFPKENYAAVDEGFKDVLASQSLSEQRLKHLINHTSNLIFSKLDLANRTPSMHINHQPTDSSTKNSINVFFDNTHEGVYPLWLPVFENANDKALDLEDKILMAGLMLDYLESSVSCSSDMNKAWIMVTAYPDSSCYQGDCGVTNHHFQNMEIANERASVVSEFISKGMFDEEFIAQAKAKYGFDKHKELIELKEITMNNIKITRQLWPSYLCNEKFNDIYDHNACLAQHDYLLYKAGFNDRDPIYTPMLTSDGYVEKMGQFNRRAVVTLMDAPKCSRELALFGNSR